MKEIKQIIGAFDKAQAAGKRTALATVVQVEGSSYRGPGARMLITEDGELTGAISGGCLEGDALRKALLVIMQERPMLVTYDTSEDDGEVMGVGLGCEGIIHVLIEPIDPEQSDHPLILLKKSIVDRIPGVLVTLFSPERKREPQQGTVFFKTSAELIQNNGGISDFLIPEAEKVLTIKQSAFTTHEVEGEMVEALIAYLPPVIKLVIAGAGNDIFPLVDMAQTLGWEVVLVDGRPHYANAARFPTCQVMLASPQEALTRLQWDEQTAFLLMTHNYKYDKALMKELLTHKLPYIGMLGPRKKWERMREELEVEIKDKLFFEEVYSPMGLDIGAESPEEIALSIVAEIKAVFAQRPGTFLRDHKGKIHPNRQTKAFSTSSLTKQDDE